MLLNHNVSLCVYVYVCTKTHCVPPAGPKPGVPPRMGVTVSVGPAPTRKATLRRKIKGRRHPQERAPGRPQDGTLDRGRVPACPQGPPCPSGKLLSVPRRVEEPSRGRWCRGCPWGRSGREDQRKEGLEEATSWPEPRLLCADTGGAGREAGRGRGGAKAAGRGVPSAGRSGGPGQMVSSSLMSQISAA